MCCSLLSTPPGLQVAEVDSKLKVSEHASVAYKVCLSWSRRMACSWPPARACSDTACIGVPSSPQLQRASMQHACSNNPWHWSLAASCLQRAQESVAPVFSRVNMAAKEQYSKALENERVNSMLHHSAKQVVGYLLPVCIIVRCYPAPAVGIPIPVSDIPVLCQSTARLHTASLAVLARHCLLMSRAQKQIMSSDQQLSVGLPAGGQLLQGPWAAEHHHARVVSLVQLSAGVCLPANSSCCRRFGQQLEDRHAFSSRVSAVSAALTTRLPADSRSCGRCGQQVERHDAGSGQGVWSSAAAG